MVQKEVRRDPALDAVRALAIVMVLVIHTAAPALSSFTPRRAGLVGRAGVGAAARPAVPLFFMCTGALMLCRDITPRRLFTHNLPRILCAMFAWAFLYRLYWLWDGRALTPAAVWDAAKRTLLLQHEFHFYYLHILLLVYAFLPALRVFVRAASRREEEYLLAVWFVTGIFLPLARNLWPFTLVYQVDGWYTMNMSYSAIGYALLGHYLRQYGPTVRRRWYGAALLGGLALTFGGCAALSLRDGALNLPFLEGMSPGPMLMALGLFGLILTGKELPARLARPVARVSRASFCTYLSHVLFQQVFLRLGVSAAHWCALSIPAAALLLLACGQLTWEILRRVPVVRTYLI